LNTRRAVLRNRLRRFGPADFFPEFSDELTMVTPESIKTAIAGAIACEHLEVRGDGQHWEAVIVSNAFDGMPRVRQHQLVYAALGDRMREEIHALSMTTLTPAQWAAAQPSGRPDGR